MSLSDYPYDPEARIETLRDLDKLRAISDPDLRASLYSIWCSVRDRGGFTRGYCAWDDETVENARVLLKNAKAGNYGSTAQAVVAELDVDAMRPADVICERDAVNKVRRAEGQHERRAEPEPKRFGGRGFA